MQVNSKLVFCIQKSANKCLTFSFHPYGKWWKEKRCTMVNLKPIGNDYQRSFWRCLTRLFINCCFIQALCDSQLFPGKSAIALELLFRFPLGKRRRRIRRGVSWKIVRELVGTFGSDHPGQRESFTLADHWPPNLPLFMNFVRLPLLSLDWVTRRRREPMGFTS